MTWQYQWFCPATESDLLKLLVDWEYVCWHGVYHAVMLRRIVNVEP
ncbi:MAG: hypothetical protein WC616_01515 [Candidatus Omnitrophota bacterium]